MRSENPPSGLLLFAKQPGITSFSQLDCIKKALKTKKIGHTGTLDRFADGLLVVLVGSLTRMGQFITAFDKSYRALIQFGDETDTLDPEGVIIESAPVPTEAAFCAIVPQFTGAIQQIPPEYSAIHIDGKRSSDLARQGRAVEVPARDVTVYGIDIVDFADGFALVDVQCSKGTYIRSLARDMARACGSRAHLAALRRTAVGGFALEDAVFADSLQPLTIALKPLPVNTPGAYEMIRDALLPMTPELAEKCGFVLVHIDKRRLVDFYNGKPIEAEWFSEADITAKAQTANTALAVFAVSGDFAGVVQVADGEFRYGFVVPGGTR